VRDARRATRIALALALAALLALAGACRRDRAIDLDGHAVDPLSRPAAATVLLFVSTRCPISNRYAPEIARLAGEFAGRSVEFFLVYPLDGDGPPAIREHLRAYSLPLTALRDPAHALVRAAGVATTPEVAVFHAGRRVYRGRIDDRQVDFGVTRPQPTRRDLESALTEVLAGRPVSVPETDPVGCSIPVTS
jgi:hypothetical protein